MEKFQIYIITQYEATLNRSMFIENIELNEDKIDIDEVDDEKLSS